MRCSHYLANGQRCDRRRQVGQRYCWQHLPAPEPGPTIATGVTPEVLAAVLNETNIPASYRRQFAVEFCEMYREKQENFDTATFMALITGR